MKHQWKEVIPPRVFGGSEEEKHAIECQICKARLIIPERELLYFANEECHGKEEVTPSISK